MRRYPVCVGGGLEIALEAWLATGRMPFDPRALAWVRRLRGARGCVVLGEAQWVAEASCLLGAVGGDMPHVTRVTPRREATRASALVRRWGHMAR
jgi:hypothetical protein